MHVESRPHLAAISLRTGVGVAREYWVPTDGRCVSPISANTQDESFQNRGGQIDRRTFEIGFVHSA